MAWADDGINRKFFKRCTRCKRMEEA